MSDERGPDPDYESDWHEPVVQRRKPMVKRPDWLAVSVAILSIITTLGAWAWWGGKFSQRMDTFEVLQQRQEERLNEFTRDNAKRDTAIAVTGQQYADIVRRLDSIERKLDKR